MSQHIIVAIDGPAGAGKSTIARRIAERLGCLYIDTGAMYRAVGLAALHAGVSFDDAAALARLAETVDLPLPPGVLEAIRSPEVSDASSKVAAVPEVREVLVRKQQSYGARESVVMEGRDIGSVVFPNATVKVYLDADPQERVRRRAAESHADEAVIARAIAERDQRDSNRGKSPLKLAPGAVLLDSTNLTIDQVEQRILELIPEELVS